MMNTKSLIMLSWDLLVQVQLPWSLVKNFSMWPTRENENFDMCNWHTHNHILVLLDPNDARHLQILTMIGKTLHGYIFMLIAKDKNY